MGLLDNVLGGLLGGSGNANASPMGGILSSLLGGNQGGPGMGNPAMGNQGFGTPAAGGTGGGLAGLLGMFQNAGLGHVANSWVGTGQNEPVSPQQLQSVFGEQQVQQMAQQANMQPHDFLGQLSQTLPKAVDGVTPNGRLPDEGTVSV